MTRPWSWDPVRPVSALTLCALAGAALAACASAPASDPRLTAGTAGREVSTIPEGERVTSVVYQGRYAYVRIERAEDAARTPNDQPIIVPAESLHTILSQLEVGGDPVFTPDELREMAGPLASALARAGPREDVTFAASAKRGPIALFVPRSVTTGRVFFADGRLNVIFGLVHRDFESQLIATGYLQPFTPGSRARRVETGWAVVPADAALASVQRGDWVTFAPTAIAAVPPAPEGARAAAPAAAAAASGGGAAPAATAPAPDARTRGIEERLETLNKLRDKGLITPEEYEEKRRAILKDL